jgi:hypothetical protein
MLKMLTRLLGAKRVIVVTLISAIALVALLVGPAIAATIWSGGPVEEVKAVTETNASVTNSTSFVDVPGASTFVTVPSGTTGIIFARFSGESSCSGGTGYCSVRIVVQEWSPTGVPMEMEPASGLDFAFDSTDGGQETSSSWESHSMDRVLNVAPGKTYLVQAQRATSQSATSFRLDDWSLTVERTKLQ